MAHRLRHLAILLAVTSLAGVLHAPARAAATFHAPTYYRPKDFTLVKKDGVYHLFYIRHSDLLPASFTEVDFGHAVSTDLHQWTHLPVVLPIDPAGWDNRHVWAPHVVEADGLYWMFYTGLSERAGTYVDTQRIGAAVSTDLMTWTRLEAGPIWDNSMSAWSWWAPLNPAMACRDPFVMRDPAAPGEWLMYFTVTPAYDTSVTMVGVARSDGGDPTAWNELKPLWITHWRFSFNTLAESPHLFEHDGTWYLFMTTNAGQPLSFYTSPDPTGEPAAWTYRGRLRNMLGYDTSSWGASEMLRDGEVDYFACVEDDHILIQRMVWAPDRTFSLEPPSRFHMNDMGWTAGGVLEHQFVGLRLLCSNPLEFQGELTAWTRDGRGLEVELPADSLGLPTRPLLTSDSLVVPWRARRWPPGREDQASMPLRVGLRDGTATTPWLNVFPNSVAQSGPIRPGGIIEDTASPGSRAEGAPDSVAAAPAAGASPAFEPRVLRGTPLGGGPAVAFELPAAGSVRAEVFDLQGRRVALLAERRFAAGTHVLAWDGRAADGGRAARGLYFVRLRLPDRSLGLRLLLDR